jgi:hypothetical protein
MANNLIHTKKAPENLFHLSINPDKIPATFIIDNAFLSLYFNTTSAYIKIGGNKGNQVNDSIFIQRVIFNIKNKRIDLLI